MITRYTFLFLLLAQTCLAVPPQVSVNWSCFDSVIRKFGMSAKIDSLKKDYPFVYHITAYIKDDSLRGDAFTVPDSLYIEIAEHPRYPYGKYRTVKCIPQKRDSIPFLMIVKGLAEHTILRQDHTVKSAALLSREETDQLVNFVCTEAYTDRKGKRWYKVAFDCENCDYTANKRTSGPYTGWVLRDDLDF